ncbi:MAG: hypothetical protein Q7S11_04445 [bacterium]|nr:hypothetical protein [bacterium]
MSLTSRTKKILVSTFVLASIGAFASIAYASHAWANYHWARTANPFTVQLGDNVTSVWDTHLAISLSDWNTSSVLNTNITTGQTNPKNCKAVNGRVEVCNSKYGNNGWLGVASISTSGNHITKGTVKLNDTYFNSVKYNTPAWKNLVMCQEIGHVFGLDHQDEIFDNPPLGTCMDYTNDPTPNQHPNTHDYDELDFIYSHLDTITTIASAISPTWGRNNSNNNDTSAESSEEWGKEVRKSKDGKNSLYERDLGKGQRVFTFVIWAN